MPKPITPRGSLEANRALLQGVYGAPTAGQSGSARAAGRDIRRQLNKQAGYTRNSPFKAKPSLNPRPWQNTPQGRQAINGVNATLQKANNSAPLKQLNKAANGIRKSPVTAKASNFINSPAGNGLLSAGLTLYGRSVDGKISGNDIAATALVAGFSAVGATAGPLGALAFGLAGDYLANRLFPAHEGFRDGYATAGDVPFQGGQSPGVLYRFNATGRSVAPDAPTPTFLPQHYLSYTIPGPINAIEVDRSAETQSEYGGAVYLTSGGAIATYYSHPFKAHLRYSLTGYSASERYKMYWDIKDVERIDGQHDTGGNPSGPPVPVAPSSPTRQSSNGPSVLGPATTPDTDPGTESEPDTGFPYLPRLPAALPVAAVGAGLAAAAARPAQSPPLGGGTGLMDAPQIHKMPNHQRRPSPRGASNPQPLSGGAGSSARPPTRTKQKNNCGCNKGILNGVKNLLSGNGLIAANTALLTKIDATTTATGTGVVGNTALLSQTLGIVQTIQQFSRKTWDFLQVDRFLAVANFTFNLHNAYFLSRSLTETIGWTVDSILNAIGLGLKDADDNPLSISELVSTWVDTAVDAVIPEETQTEVTETLNKANRIYQATSNIYWQLWSLFDSSQVILETVGQYVGKIGNALRRSGSVMEGSYGWMSERFDAVYTSGSRWNQIQDRLNTAEDAISAVGLVAGEVVSIQDIASELPQQRQELTNAIRVDGDGAASDGDVSSVPRTESEAELKLDSEATVALEAADFDPTVAGRPED